MDPEPSDTLFETPVETCGLTPKCMKTATLKALAAVLLAGCATNGTSKPERGPEGTIAYSIQIESSEPGARVEANGEYLGKTPIVVKIFGDKDGTFHNFGADDYVIKVYPVKQGQYLQTKVFRTGRWFSQQDKIPSKLYFDLEVKSEGFTIDLPAQKSTQP
ncbi:MAG TPA: PEGA domain-containing protein [Verrucomicrobiae bacterium]|nr:PEGA domain-containing protein [Verrucomicrobiae bacterium]